MVRFKILARKWHFFKKGKVRSKIIPAVEYAKYSEADFSTLQKFEDLKSFVFLELCLNPTMSSSGFLTVPEVHSRITSGITICSTLKASSGLGQKMTLTFWTNSSFVPPDSIMELPCHHPRRSQQTSADSAVRILSGFTVPCLSVEICNFQFGLQTLEGFRVSEFRIWAWFWPTDTAK